MWNACTSISTPSEGLNQEAGSCAFFFCSRFRGHQHLISFHYLIPPPGGYCTRSGNPIYMNRWPLTITAATPSSRGRAMVSIMLWPRRNIEILGVILLIVSSAGGFVTTTQQQTPRRYVPPRQVRRHGYSRGTPGVTTTSGTTCLLGCATNSNGGALSSNNYIARLARFQSLGLQDEVLGSSSFCGASQRRYLHPGSRATLLMMSPPLPSQTHHSQGDSARNGETGAKKEPLVRPPSRKINAWHLPGVPVVPKAAESAANVTASPNSTSPITTSNISKTVDVNVSAPLYLRHTTAVL